MSCLSNIIIHNLPAILRGSLFSYLTASLVAIAATTLPTLGDEVKEPVLPSGLTLLTREGGYNIVNGPDGHGLCSESGKLVIPARFNQIRFVGDQRFVAQAFQDDGSTRCWLFDGKGRVISRLPDWTYLSDRQFHEGLLNIGDSYSPTAFVDLKGNVLPNFDKYTDVLEFSNGLATASISNREGRGTGFINHQGKMVIGPFKNGEVSKFENGLAVVSSSPAVVKPKYGIVSTSGKFVVPMTYDAISAIGNGKFWAHKNNRVWILDSSGKVFIQFPRGCTSAAPPDKFEKNTWIACGFGGKINQSLKWGYCDVAGKIVMSPRFAAAESFIGKKAVAYEKLSGIGLACGVIDRQGNWVVKPKYRSIALIDDNHWNLGEVATGREPAGVPNARSARALIFQEVMQNHDLIGMPLNQFEELVGKLESPPYLNQTSEIGVKTAQTVLVDSMCGPGSVVLNLAFDSNDKITGWRVLEGGVVSHSQPWITENVVLDDPQKGLQLSNLVPKN